MSQDEVNIKLQKNALLSLYLGGIASMCAGGITHPIDTCKIRLQNSNGKDYRNILQTMIKIIKEEGVRGIYKGLSASLLREGSYSTLRLGLYEPIKEGLGYRDKRNCPVYIKLLAGLGSGGIGAILSTPFDLLKVRQQSVGLGSVGSFEEVLRSIVREKGIKGLWRGSTANVIRGSILTGTKMATYDSTKQWLIIRGYSDNMSTFFLSSLITALVLTLVTSPIDLVKTRLMSAQYSYHGILHVIHSVYSQESLSVFFRALLPQFIRFGPFNIIQLVLWEQLKLIYNVSTI